MQAIALYFGILYNNSLTFSSSSEVKELFIKRWHFI